MFLLDSLQVGDWEVHLDNSSTGTVQLRLGSSYVVDVHVCSPPPSPM